MRIVTWYNDLAAGEPWVAVDDNKYDGDSQCNTVGHGDTEIEAVRDLLEQVEEKAERATRGNA